ncbi:MAG: molybdate ABC transporter substrate-binding protein, partial [Alphaproteobacteria bacterium]
MEHNARRRVLRAAGATLALAAATRPARARDGFAVAAASSLRPALDEVVAAFRAREGGGPVEVAYGASGNLARQVVAGAPFRLLFAADEASVLQVHAAGRAEDAGRVYARGRLALVVRRDGAVAADPRLAGLLAALRAGAVRRLAIANPGLAPYGLAARQALEAAGAWPLAAPRIALGETVAQAAQFVVSGAAEAGFAALSTALAPGLDARIAFAVVDAGLHAPIRHRMALVGVADTRARRLLDFVLGAEARAILARHGFDPP